MTAARYVTALLAAFDRFATRPALVFEDSAVVSAAAPPPGDKPPYTDPAPVLPASGGTELTYGEVGDWSYRIARALRTLGVGRGEGVTCIMGNRPELLLIRLAAHVLGARVTTVVLDTAAHGIEHILRDSEPKIVVTESPLQVESDTHAVTMAELMALAVEQPSAPIAVAAREDDIARVTYTSGTTGLPKGVATTFAAMGARAPRLDGAAADHTFVSVTSLAQRAGGRCLEQFLAGGRVEILPTFSLEAFIAACRRAAPVAAYLIPYQIYELLDHPLTKHGIPGLVSVAYGASAIAPSRLREALDRFGADEFRQGYGMNESAVISRLTPDDHRAGLESRPQLLASVGRPVPGVRVEIQDKDGTPVPLGQVGEVCVHSPAMMSGYWRRPDLTIRVLRDGWLHTQDLGRFDAEGYLYLVGRLSDMIVVKGDNCYAGPIEAALMRHPAVAAAAVVGYEPEPGSEEVHAFLVPSPGHNGTAEIAATACGQVVTELAEVHRPTTVHWVPELPLVPTGKPDKKRLRASIPSRLANE